MQISEVIGINLGARQQQRKQIVPATPIADQLKHELVIRKLTRQLTRKSNLPNPTQQDVNAAIQRYKTDQKRVDLDYQKQLNSAQR
jgi:ribosomal protein L1